jgi:predicted ATPase
MRFGDFTVDPVNAQVMRSGVEVPLRPKAFDVLCCLVERRGMLVTKDEILALVWPGVAVGDANLQACLSDVRQALGEDPKSPGFVETVHGRGYRFRAEARGAVSPREAAATAVPSGRTAARAIVGREPELHLLARAFDEVTRGRRRAVFISGEAGIGKTSVVESFLADVAAPRHCWIARGQCVTHFGAEVPYLPVFEALSMLAGESSEQVLPVLRSSAPTWLGQMIGVTTLRERAQLARVTAAASGERLMREFAEAIEALARDRPVVLWLDDLHDCDTSTLQLLGYLVRRVVPARVLIIGSHRPTVAEARGGPLRRIALELRERSLSREVLLGGLGVAAVDEYLRARLPLALDGALAVLAQRVHARTEGHPLFVVHLTDELVCHGDVWGTDSLHTRVTAIPHTLEEMLRAQLGVLPERDREILDAASVAGVRFAVQTIDAVCGGAALDVESVLERLGRAQRFVEPDGIETWPDGTRAVMYRFRHALQQEVAYRQLATLRRESLHQRIAKHREQTHGSFSHHTRAGR